MGLISADFSGDFHLASSGSNRFFSPPAIHLTLSQEELLERSFSLYQGSGGTVATLLSTTPSGAYTKVYVAPKNKLATIVNDICDSFGLTKDELARACGIQSRKTLYNWINGEATPRKSAMNRLYELQLLSRAWLTSGFSIDRSQLFEPVVDGKSVFDLLSEPNVDRDTALFAGSRLNLMSPVKGDLPDPFA